MEIKQAIAYIRVSTQGQDQDDKFGKEAQKDIIDKYAKEHGYEIIEYLEDTISGVKEDREEFDKILNDYNDIDVIVAKSDRISRDMQLYWYYTMKLQKHNVRIVSVQEDFEQFGEFSNIIKSFVMFVAEQERKNITKRTSGGRSVKASKGGYSGGKAPYGYKAVSGQYEVDPYESQAVRIIFRLRDEGKTYAAIVEKLAKKGFKTRKGIDFSTSTIASILNNRKTYEGYYKYGNQDWVKGEHEAILEEK